MINALASLLLPIPSLRWLASLSFPNQIKETCGGGQGKKLNAGAWKEKDMWVSLGVLRGKNVEGAGRYGMDRYRALVIPGFLVFSFPRRKSRDKRARFAPLPIPSLRWLASLSFPNQMKETCGGGQGKKLNAGAWKEKDMWVSLGVLREKNVEGAGRYGMDRYRALVIPGFLVFSFSRRKSRDKRARFAPLPIPSLRWLASLFFPNQMNDTCLQGPGKNGNSCAEG
ncbi:hypothetical protein [Paenibacillus xylanexedens]|uniref:hypothetical protein n=1 Tax=Paenibacillus xylanexedens TaxID=528191 RepID=UPI0011A2ACA0|nr:hypothetical protein [Paenibacillus xylanexedens]